MSSLYYYDKEQWGTRTCGSMNNESSLRIINIVVQDNPSVVLHVRKELKN